LTLPLRIGIAGTGWGAEVLAPAAAATPDVEIVAFCSAHADRAAAAAQQFGARWAFDDYRQLLALDELDLVCVCTAPAAHEEIVGAAIDAGRHVFCTKPLARTAAAARALFERAEARGVTHALDLGRRYAPAHRHLRQLVQDGFIGELRMASVAVFASYGVDPTLHPYYANWLSRRPDGGILHASFLNHHLDLLRFTFGEIDSVGGLSATLISDKPVKDDPATTEPADAEDGVAMHGRFLTGGLFGLTGSWAVHHAAGQRWEIYGSHGTLMLDRDERLFGARAGGGPLQELPTPPEFAFATRSQDRMQRLVPLYSALLAELRDQILGRAGASPIYGTFADGVRLLEIGEAVRSI
jgi:predicted dehydrogenase